MDRRKKSRYTRYRSYLVEHTYAVCTIVVAGCELYKKSEEDAFETARFAALNEAAMINVLMRTLESHWFLSF